MVEEERRRDHRFLVMLAGSLARGRAPVWIENVAYRGVLLVTKRPVPLGELSQFGVAIAEDEDVRLHGVAVRVARVAVGERACVLGMRLIGTEPRWERFIRGLHASGRILKAAAPEPVSLPNGREPSSAGHERKASG